MGYAAAACFTSLTAGEGGFRALDERVRDPAAKGFLRVHGPRPALEAACAHLVRRARALGRVLVAAGRFDEPDPWRGLALRCGVLDADPIAAAQAILAAAEGAIVVVLEGHRTAWGRLVAEEVVSLAADGAGGALVVALGESANEGGVEPRLAPISPWAQGVALGAELSPDELRRFCEALAHDVERRIGARAPRLDALEDWWSAAMATPIGRRPELPAPSAAAERLLHRIALGQRPWRAAELARLAGAPCAAAVDELVALGLAEADERGFVVARAAIAPEDAAPADVIAAAEALDDIPSDPWAAARAAELYASAGLEALAEAAAMRALGAAGEPSVRADLWRRWSRALSALPRAGSAERLLRAAERALRLGDVEIAYDFSSAAVRERESCDALLTHGRATGARGDLVTAQVVLARAFELAPDAAARARCAVEKAELCSRTGAVAEARRYAELGLAGAPDLATRLQARNVIGKLLLSGKDWDAAERHFAADAWEAERGGDTVGALRARLNRAIAVISSGRHDEARSMLVDVLQEGERAGERMAAGYALTNLAVIAHLRHEYLESLRLSERAIEIFRTIGEKVTLMNLIANLAELRLELGLLAEAEQALAFGRKVCGPVVPGVRVTYLSLVAAQIHLAHGRTLEASAEVVAALACAPGASSGAKLGECYALAARVALEDGDLGRAEAMLAKARAEANGDRGHAEVALLEAAHARASGEPFKSAAGEALALSRAADDRRRACAAHVLLHHAALLEGDAACARAHLEQALALRDRLAGSLPADMRARFLARREFAELARIETRARSAPPDAKPCEVCGAAACGGCSRPSLRGGPWSQGAPRGGGAESAAIKRMVGSDPALAALRSHIQKVGATDMTVLVHGESGTGKELVAEAIHEASGRRSGPLVKVNCAALVESLLLSELFGHEKGSFTGAGARRRGRFEAAEGGTLFLDEIGDISPATQVALLRVLQDRTFERVGGNAPLRANVRIVCATHRDLRAMVARGEFREDLYYRLRQVVLEVPALRQRPGDLPVIAAAILDRIAAERGDAPKRLSRRALEGLIRYGWPGNVRELENALRAAAVFADEDVIELEDLTGNVEGLRGLEQIVPGSNPPPSDPGAAGARPQADAEATAGPQAAVPDRAPLELAYAHVRKGVSLSDMKREIERECIARALAESGGNITRAAALLGMKRPRLSQLVKQYGFGADSED